MRDSLVARGIPAEDIYLDGKGYRTINSVINANKEGLLSLANILTALSHETASGAHIHLDQYNSLEDGSTELIIAKND